MLLLLTLNVFTSFSSVFIIDFEQVIVCWVHIGETFVTRIRGKTCDRLGQLLLLPVGAAITANRLVTLETIKSQHVMLSHRIH